jgi:hypothetical protein
MFVFVKYLSSFDLVKTIDGMYYCLVLDPRVAGGM